MNLQHESNREAWNEAASYYQLKELELSLDLLKKGGMTFCPPELKHFELLRKNNKIDRCIHLQCAAGTDSLSLLHFGAKEVVGIDISDEMIQLAQKKTDTLKMNARWVRSDILNVPADLNETADLVYTGKGALNWIMDITGWAQVVKRLLKPGGVLYLFEGHPFTYVFDMKAPSLQIDPIYRGYFSKSPYTSQEWPDTYVGKLKENEKDQATKYEKPWPVSEVIQSLLNAGLILQKFEEHPDKYWDEFPNLPDQQREYFPNTYSIVAMKPAK